MSSSALAAGLRHLRGKLAAQQHSDDSDEQLLHAFLANGDDNAFAALVRRHGPMVLHLCRRVLGHEQDAEDAFQATFLVLSRQASKLRKKASLASWLHGIAYRISLKAKQAAARRRKHEGRASPRTSAEPSVELLWHEVRALLDDEIARLPEKYRSVFVLFYLEDCGREETARRLGLKEGTAASRLDKARKRLAQRLARRGVELTAVLAASAVATQSAPALSPLLISTTIKAVLADGTAGLVSVPVAGLAKSAASALMLSKIKMAAIFLMAATFCAGVGLCLFVKPQAAFTPPAAPAAAKTDDNKAALSPNRVEVQGRVLGPDGKPKAGAKLLLLGMDKKIVQLGVTAADGRFSVWVPKETKDYYLIAQSDDSGFDTLERGNLKTEEPVELHLVKDQPIRGRVVNTEGKPVAGVRVAATEVNIYPNNSLDWFLNYWKNRRVGENPLGGWGPHDAADALFATTTDAQGRFLLRGLGVERFVPIRLSGAGIAAAELWIVTRPNFDPKPINQAVLDNTPKDMINFFGPGRQLHGPEVTVVAEAEKIIRGCVKEAKSGKGRPNVGVVLHQGLNPSLDAQTDAEGRYEIRGARKAKSYALEVGSDDATGLMGSQVRADDTPGYQPVTADLSVRQGVIVTGKMIDQATGNPMSGMVRIVALKDNLFVKDYPGIESVGWNSVRVTDANGVFRVVAIPGPVLLMGGPRGTGDDFKYKRSEVDPKYRPYFRNNVTFYGLSGGFSPIQGIYFKVLEIKPDAKIVEQNIVLERWPALTVQLQDDDGKPLTNVYVTGLTGEGHYPTWDDGGSCSVYGIQPGKPRMMVFYHPKRKLAATLTLKGDEKQPVVVKLGPAGAIKGRLLDIDDKPLAGIRIDLHYHHLNADAMHRCTHEEMQIVTDANGAFAHDDVIPGCKFELSFRRGRQRFEREIKPADATIQVKPGEYRDLGALKLK